MLSVLLLTCTETAAVGFGSWFVFKESHSKMMGRVNLAVCSLGLQGVARTGFIFSVNKIS